MGVIYRRRDGDVRFIVHNIGGSCSESLFETPAFSGEQLRLRTFVPPNAPPMPPRGFRVPLVPLLPLVSIACCVVLIAGLPLLTWLRFFAWLALGLGIYFFYSRKRIDENWERGPGAGRPKLDPATRTIPLARTRGSARN